jgi:NAD(P)-dependent dehydrogenase (short-subunit alcohol dehydrogenase family)
VSNNSHTGRSLAGKVAVVTGAGRRRGLGEGIVRRLAAAGAQVVLSDIGVSADAATPSSMVGSSAQMRDLAAEIAAAHDVRSDFPVRRARPCAGR